MTAEQIPLILALTLSIIGSVGLAIMVFTDQFRERGVKIFGGLLTCGLAFASNNAFVYGIAIFVTATLVTELQFLEKLGALAWGRKEYWNYLLQTASPSKVQQKAEDEAKELSLEAESSGDRDTQNLNPLDFEAQAVAALKNIADELGLSSITRNAEIRGPSGTAIIDAVGTATDRIVVCEIKASASSRVLQRAAEQVSNSLRVYNRYLHERGRVVNVYPLIVSRVAPNGRNSVRGIPVLQYDPESQTFSNLALIKERVAIQWSDGSDGNAA